MMPNDKEMSFQKRREELLKSRLVAEEPTCCEQKDERNVLVRKDNDYVLVNNKTYKIVAPYHWSYNPYFTPFQEGLAAVEDENGRYGFIDKEGRTVIPYSIIAYNKGFQEGLCAVEDETGRWGFIDKGGGIVIPCKWKEVGVFSGGLAKVKDDNGKYGYIDRYGDMVISCKWMRADGFHEGMALVENESWNYGFIDTTGKLVIPCTLDWKSQYSSFSEGLAWVANKDGKYGYIDKDGKTVIPFVWSNGWNFSEGLAPVKQEGTPYGCWLLINKNGCLVSSSPWQTYDPPTFHEGLAMVKEIDGKCGYIDKTGQNVIPCIWHGANSFSNGLAAVWDDDERCGYIDKTGKVVIPCKWKVGHSFFDEIASVEDEKGRSWLIDKTGAVLSEF